MNDNPLAQFGITDDQAEELLSFTEKLYDIILEEIAIDGDPEQIRIGDLAKAGLACKYIAHRIDTFCADNNPPTH